MLATTAPQEIHLTKQHLQILAATFAGRYDVKVSETAGNGLWTVSVTLPETVDPHPVMTARGDTKIWRDVVGALTFVQTNCASAKSVTVHVGDWLLCWKNPC